MAKVTLGVRRISPIAPLAKARRKRMYTDKVAWHDINAYETCDAGRQSDDASPSNFKSFPDALR